VVRCGVKSWIFGTQLSNTAGGFVDELVRLICSSQPL